LTLTSSQTGLIEQIAAQTSRAAVQESLSITQLTSRTLDTSLSADAAMRLPKLYLPNFDENILKQPEFWDILKLSVDKQNIA